METEKPTPNIPDFLKGKIYKRFGIPGLCILMLLGGLGYAWTRWNEIKTWPGIEFFLRKSIPRTDSKRFSVLIAHLENDPNHDHERLIIELLKEFKGIQIVTLDRFIVKDNITEEEEKKGHEKARAILKESGASVLIWGTILHNNDKTIPKLYWTASYGEPHSGQYRPLAETEFRLPEIFWKDLAQILQLLVAKDDADFQANRGRYVADRLPPFIARVRTLLRESANNKGWNDETRLLTRMILTNALFVLGEQSGESIPLDEVVLSYREVLKEYPQERFPLGWAMIQNILGSALGILGERESGTARLDEAVLAFREALKVYTRDRAPLDWAMIQNNLGSALQTLGERESGTGRLDEAVLAYREALKECTRDRFPLRWAMIQSNLGNSLRALGERESGTERLDEAVLAFREALKEFELGQHTYYVSVVAKNLKKVKIIIQQRTESGASKDANLR